MMIRRILLVIVDLVVVPQQEHFRVMTTVSHFRR